MGLVVLARMVTGENLARNLASKTVLYVTKATVPA
jgi:hypothetical protein